MNYLAILRRLADLQQFSSLRQNTERYLQETADLNALPLLALAHAQLGERQQVAAVLVRLNLHLVEIDLDARVDLAGVYCQLWRLDEAVRLLEAALGAEPEHSLAMARLAWCQMQFGRMDEARALYQRSAASVPQRLPVWIGLASLCLQAKDAASAQQALDDGIAQLKTLHDEMQPEAVALFTAQFRGLQLEVWVAAEALAQAEQWLERRRKSLDEDEWVSLVTGYALSLAACDQHAAAEEALRGALKYYPENLALISQMAELAQLQGRTGQVMFLLRKAIRLARQQEKPESGYWVRLSSACLHQDEVQARAAAEQAAELVAALKVSEATPEVMIRQLQLQARNALAQVESQEQNFDAAEKLFREVLEENPYFLPALQGLGQQQMQVGKIDEAVELFERIKEIDPAKGYSSLINARRFPEDRATLERMEKLARQPSLEGSARSGLLFQLAAAWEKRKEYDKAFSLARDANEASKKLLNYDPKAHRQRCARIRHAFSCALYEHRKGCGVDSTLPVYVVGMPRSGTTLVEQIIAGHSQICGAGELGVIPQVIAGLERWERHTGSGRHYPDCIDDLNPYVTAGIANNVLKDLREYDPQVKHVVDKLPHNFENIGLIKFLFPKAKIISVRRDPRDIGMSNYFTDYQAKHGGMGFAYDLEWIGQQLADHNLFMHYWHQVFPGEILEINYEDVVENTEAMARKMLDYIGVAWEPQVLNFNELDRPVKTASVWQVRQPIYKTSKAKWECYANHLAPLIAGTNAKITWEPIEMVTLPEPGLLTGGVAFYREKKLDDAEHAFKKLLHHLPEHAAANFILGLIYVGKGHLQDGIALMEKGKQKCPWNPKWHKDMIQVYEMAGEPEKAEALKRRRLPGEDGEALGDDDAHWQDALSGFAGEERIDG